MRLLGDLAPNEKGGRAACPTKNLKSMLAIVSALCEVGSSRAVVTVESAARLWPWRQLRRSAIFIAITVTKSRSASFASLRRAKILFSARRRLGGVGSVGATSKLGFHPSGRS